MKPASEFHRRRRKKNVLRPRSGELEKGNKMSTLHYRRVHVEHQHARSRSPVALDPAHSNAARCSWLAGSPGENGERWEGWEERGQPSEFQMADRDVLTADLFLSSSLPEKTKQLPPPSAPMRMAFSSPARCALVEGRSSISGLPRLSTLTSLTSPAGNGGRASVMGRGRSSLAPFSASASSSPSSSFAAAAPRPPPEGTLITSPSNTFGKSRGNKHNSLSFLHHFFL